MNYTKLELLNCHFCDSPLSVDLVEVREGAKIKRTVSKCAACKKQNRIRALLKHNKRKK